MHVCTHLQVNIPAHTVHKHLVIQPERCFVLRLNYRKTTQNSASAVVNMKTTNHKVGITGSSYNGSSQSKYLSTD